MADGSGNWPNFTINSQTGGTRRHLVLEKVQEFGSDNTGGLPAWVFTHAERFLRYNGAVNIHGVPFLTGATNGYGGNVTFSYQPAASYATGGPEDDVVQWHAVATRTTYDGVSGGNQQESYTSDYPEFSIAENPQRPDFRGFNTVTVTDALNPAIKQVHRFFQGSDGAQRARSDGTILTDSEGLIGREYETVWQDGANVLRKQWTAYQQATWVGPVLEPPGETPDRKIYFSAPNDIRDFQGARSKKQTMDYEDVYGNWNSKKEYSDANATQWYRHTKQAFASSPNTGDWIVGKPRWVNVYEWDGSADGSWKQSTSYYYDGNPHLLPSRPVWGGSNATILKPGNIRVVRRAIRTVDQWPHRLNYFSDTFYDYDLYGNREKETVTRVEGTEDEDSQRDQNAWGTDPAITQWKAEGPNPGEEAMGYDKVFHTFPRFVDNAAGHRVTHTFDPRWGLPLTVSNPHIPPGSPPFITRGYDEFGRPKRVWYQDDVVGAPSGPADPAGASLLSIYTDTSPFKVETQTKKSGTSYHKGYRFYDGLGREVQRYSDGVEIGGVKWVIINTHYSNRGLVEWESVPYFLNSTPLSQGNFDSAAWNDTTRPRSQYGWDALRRPTTVTNPDNTQRSTGYDGWDLILLDENNHKKVQKMDAFVRLVTVEEYTGNSALSWSLYAATNYGYDVLDNMTTVSDAATPPNVTTVTWDGLSRKTQMSDPDMGNWGYALNAAGDLISQTDARGQTITFVRDALGRMTRKYYPKEWVDSTLTTNHTVGVYDLMELRASIDVDRLAAGVTPNPYPWNNPAIVAGRDVTIRAIHFNEMRDAAIQGLWNQAGMGAVPGFTRGPIQVDPPRPVSLMDPTDLRGWLVQYESSAWASGNGKRARAVYRFDNYSDGSYNPGNSSGRRTEMWDVTGHTRWTYDERGRIIKEEKWIDGQLYTTQRSCDSMDRPTSMTFPDGEVVTYTYNSQLLLASMTSSAAGSIAADIGYNALSLPTQVKLPNAVNDLYLRYRYYVLDFGTYPYGALWDIRLERPLGANLLRLEHGYDLARNITRTIESPNWQDFTFVLDDLDRVTARRITGGADQETFGYNQIGNITSKNGVPYTYHATKPHAVINDGSNPYGYDNNGNMTQKGGLYLKLDAENRVVKVSTDLNGLVYAARFGVDGDGRRVKRVDNFGTVHYVGPHYERNVGTPDNITDVVTRFYVAQMGKTRRIIAFRRGSTLYYLAPDHLGGTLSVRDTQGNEVGSVRYNAFGSDRSSSGTLNTDKKFTGETLDASSGLYCLGARYYDPMLGRFLSPDPMIPNFKNPQNLNRYSYALNNPLKYIDPSGNREEYGDDSSGPPGDPPDGGPPDGGQGGDLQWGGDGSSDGSGAWDCGSGVSEQTPFAAPPDPSGIPPEGDIPAPEASPSPSPTPEPPAPVMVVPETDSPQPAPPDMEPPVEQGEPVGHEEPPPWAATGPAQPVDVNWGEVGTGAFMMVTGVPIAVVGGIVIGVGFAEAAACVTPAAPIAAFASIETISLGGLIATTGVGLFASGAYLVGTGAGWVQ